MSSFKGEYEHSVDNKGRASFPAKLRKYLNPQAQERFTILKGLEKCLYLYPQDEWEKVEAKLSKVNVFAKRGRTAVRNFLRSAEDVSLDKQNRIAIPSKLMEWSGIDSKVIFIGSGERIELWSPDELAIEDENLSFESYQELFEEVMGNLEDE
ncbi:MAG TPA: division/cell wall cluster transcriptional repressor MraZ [Balneolales bacterium]|nr:division/cell wall cluster transcriptional repressor MraZ [Balneolales bacterium]